jgi:hypothetical protein
MDPDMIKQLVEKAKSDPEFFHALVFDPDKALNRLDMLERRQKAALFAVDPEEFITQILTPTTAIQCDPSCGSSCDVTCGKKSCPRTCGVDSCSSTCNRSCGYTLQILPEVGPVVS